MITVVSVLAHNIGVLRDSSPTLRRNNGTCTWIINVVGFDIEDGMGSEYVIAVRVTSDTTQFVLRCEVDGRTLLAADFLVHGEYIASIIMDFQNTMLQTPLYASLFCDNVNYAS